MAESTGIFLIDGESAGSTPWEFDSISESGSNTFALSSAAANNGSYGYKLTWDGTNEGCYATKDQAFSTPNDFYLRFYIYIPSGQTIDSSGYLGLMNLVDFTTYAVYSYIKADGTGTPERWRFVLQGITSYESNTNFTMDAWHYVEVHYVQSSTVGGIQVWVDGDSIIDDLTNDTSGAGWEIDSVQFGDNAGRSIGTFDTNGDYIYLDDIKADSSAIGAYTDTEVTLEATVEGVSEVPSPHMHQPSNVDLAASIDGACSISAGAESYAGFHYLDNSLSTGANDGSSWSDAWRSFADVDWGQITAGEVLYVSGGASGQTYEEDVEVGCVGSSSAQVTISGAVEAGYNGTVTISSGGVNVRSKQYVTVKNLTINHSGDSWAIWLEDGVPGLILENLDITVNVPSGSGNRGGIYLNSGSGNSDSVTVRDCTITVAETDYDVGQIDNIAFYDVAGGITIEGCTIINNNTRGGSNHQDVIQTGWCTNVVIRNNWLEQNCGMDSSGPCMLSYTDGYLHLYNNVIFGSSGEPFHSVMITQDDTAESDYRATILIYNNLFVSRCASTYTDVSTGLVLNADGRTWANNTLDVRNNIFRNTTSANYILWGIRERGSVETATITAIDYNVYYNAADSENDVVGYWDGSNRTLAQLQALGYEANGLDTSPGVSLENGLFTSANANGIDVGTDLSATFTTDRQGLARPQGPSWDVGPAEYPTAYPQDLEAMVDGVSVTPSPVLTVTLDSETHSLAAEIAYPNLRSHVYAEMSGGTPVRGNYTHVSFSRHRHLQRIGVRSP